MHSSYCINIWYSVDLQEASRRKRADASRTKCMTSETGAVSIRPSNSTEDDDRPLSTWFGLMQGQPGATEISKLLLQALFQILVFACFLFFTSTLFKCFWWTVS